jgi:hypothetical protein
MHQCDHPREHDLYSCLFAIDVMPQECRRRLDAGHTCTSLLNTACCQRANYLVSSPSAPSRCMLLFTKNKHGRYWRRLSNVVTRPSPNCPRADDRRLGQRPLPRPPPPRHRPRITSSYTASDSLRREPTSVASRYKLACRRVRYIRLAPSRRHCGPVSCAAAAAAAAAAAHTVSPSVRHRGSGADDVRRRFEAWRVI